jgi:hypothetical protein
MFVLCEISFAARAQREQTARFAFFGYRYSFFRTETRGFRGTAKN